MLIVILAIAVCYHCFLNISSWTYSIRYRRNFLFYYRQFRYTASAETHKRNEKSNTLIRLLRLFKAICYYAIVYISPCLIRGTHPSSHSSWFFYFTISMSHWRAVSVDKALRQVKWYNYEVSVFMIYKHHRM